MTAVLGMSVSSEQLEPELSEMLPMMQFPVTFVSFADGRAADGEKNLLHQ